MSDLNEVQPSVTQGVTTDGLAVIGQASAVSIGELYQTLGDAIAKAAINNVFAQQQANMTGQAANTAGLADLFSVPI